MVAPITALLESTLSGKQVANFELQFSTKPSSSTSPALLRYLLLNATTKRNPDGSVIGVIFVAQDVTDNHIASSTSHQLAQELRQLVDKANAPIFGIDTDGLVNEWNDKTAEITGYKKEEAWGKRLIEGFIKESLRENVENVMRNALQV
jgi:PAS domain-containing protein